VSLHRPGLALVTGASGFLGHHLVEHLLAEGVAVRALVRRREDADRLTRRGVEVRVGDITEATDVGAAVDAVDTVFHLAAIVGPAAVSQERFDSINAGGTRNVLDACRERAGIARIVHVSSVAVTEGAGGAELVTESTRAAPAGRYGISKWRAEQAVRAACDGGLPVVTVRPSWVYGWRAPGAVKLFQRIAHRRMVLIGRADNIMQPIAVEDVVDGLWRAATVAGIGGEVFQFAGPETVTTGAFCREVALALGVDPPRLHVPRPVASAAARLCEWVYPANWGKPPIDRNKLAFFTTSQRHSNVRAASTLGWTPAIGVRAGVANAVRDMRARGLL